MGIKTHYQPQGKKLKWMSSVPSSPKAMPVIYTRLHAKPTFQLSSSSNSGREEEFAFSHEQSKDSLHTFLKERTFRNLESLCHIISECKKQQGVSEDDRANDAILQRRKLRPEKANELPASGTGQNRCAVKEQLLRDRGHSQKLSQCSSFIGSPLIR